MPMYMYMYIYVRAHTHTHTKTHTETVDLRSTPLVVFGLLQHENKVIFQRQGEWRLSVFNILEIILCLFRLCEALLKAFV